MYTKEEKELAKSIVDNKPLMALLRKVLLPEDKKISAVARQFITLPHDEYASLVKAISEAENKVEERLSELHKIAGYEATVSTSTSSQAIK